MMMKADVRAFKQYMPSDYRGRTLYILRAQDTPPISDYWDSGSRRYAQFRSVPDGQPVTDVPFERQVAANPYGLRLGTATLRPGVCLVEYVYSGTRKYVAITPHPADADAFRAATQS